MLAISVTGLRRSVRAALLAALTVLIVLVLASSAGAVIDGQPDGNQHANVGLIFGVDSQGTGIYSCTGTLIDPTTVLTAAHCVGGEDFGEPVARILIDFDNHLRQLSDGRYLIEHYITGTGEFHPRFQDIAISSGSGGTKTFTANSAYDIGVIHLSARADTVFPGIQPRPITGVGTNDQYRTGTTKKLVLQVGYGVQRLGAPGQPDSLFIDYTRNQSLIQPKKLTDSLLFLGANPDDALGFGTPCSGDSGSPVLRGEAIISLFTFAEGNCKNIGGGPRLDSGPARAFLRSQGLVP
jgi:trypsin